MRDTPMGEHLQMRIPLCVMPRFDASCNKCALQELAVHAEAHFWRATIQRPINLRKNESMKRTTIALAMAATAAIFLAACGKTEQGTQTTVNAPARQAIAPDAQSKDDLARIRELMEKEEARKQLQEAKSKATQKAIADGGKAPVPTFGR